MGQLVSTPTVVGDRMQVWSTTSLRALFLNCMFLMFEFYIVIAEAVREHLCNNRSALSRSGLAGCLDVEVNFNWEGNALSSQLFNCLLFVLFCFFSINTNWCFTIFFCKTQFFSLPVQHSQYHQRCSTDLHGVEVVFTNHWVNCVGTFKVIGQI